MSFLLSKHAMKTTLLDNLVLRDAVDIVPDPRITIQRRWIELPSLNLPILRQLRPKAQLPGRHIRCAEQCEYTCPRRLWCVQHGLSSKKLVRAIITNIPIEIARPGVRQVYVGIEIMKEGLRHPTPYARLPKIGPQQISRKQIAGHYSSLLES